LQQCSDELIWKAAFTRVQQQAATTFSKLLLGAANGRQSLWMFTCLKLAVCSLGMLHA
jgi:hypothetical protein